MRITKVRYEHFGGIIAAEDPVGLYFVDREFLQSRGYDGATAWQGDDPGYLTAPIEVELSVTEACNLHCSCCYTDSHADGRHLPWDRAEEIVDMIADMQVFHVAFGGGEPLLYPDLFRLATRARERGLLPALTTNGTLITKSWAKEAVQLFGRVNVSVAAANDIRELSPSAFQSISILAEAGVRTGINLIVHPGMMSHLDLICRQARANGADSVLFLRPKPSGRGRFLYDRLSFADVQGTSLLNQLRLVGKRAKLPWHLDCALAPLLLREVKSRKTLDFWGASGCIAGSLLLTIDLDGNVHPCSHLRATAGHYSDLPALWRQSDLLRLFRQRSKAVAGACAVCQVLDLCSGGCAVVNEYYDLPFTEGEPDVCSLSKKR